MTPANKNVIVEQIKEEMAGSIMLVGQAQKGHSCYKGKIIGVGSLCNSGVSVGDIVLYSRDEGRDVDGMTCVHEDHLLCVVGKDDDK